MLKVFFSNLVATRHSKPICYNPEEYEKRTLNVATRHSKPICYNTSSKLSDRFGLRLDTQNQYAIIAPKEDSASGLLRLDTQNQYAIIRNIAKCSYNLLRLDTQNQYAIMC